MREFYLVKKTGSLHNLKLNRSEVPALEKGKVLVGVKSIGLNYADIFAIMGLTARHQKYPSFQDLNSVVMCSLLTLMILYQDKK